MTRKRFIKLLMAQGKSRNYAVFLATKLGGVWGKSYAEKLARVSLYDPLRFLNDAIDAWKYAIRYLFEPVKNSIRRTFDAYIAAVNRSEYQDATKRALAPHVVMMSSEHHDATHSALCETRLCGTRPSMIVLDEIGERGGTDETPSA